MFLQRNSKQSNGEVYAAELWKTYIGLTQIEDSFRGNACEGRGFRFQRTRMELQFVVACPMKMNGSGK